nr:unnamed protein product [Digitaria exilis]
MVFRFSPTSLRLPSPLSERADAPASGERRSEMTRSQRAVQHEEELGRLTFLIIVGIGKSLTTKHIGSFSAHIQMSFLRRPRDLQRLLWSTTTEGKMYVGHKGFKVDGAPTVRKNVDFTRCFACSPMILHPRGDKYIAGHCNVPHIYGSIW